PVPPAVALIQRSERGNQRSEPIEFVGARQCKDGTQNEQGQRGAEETLRGPGWCGRICGGSHCRFLMVTPAKAAAVSLGGETPKRIMQEQNARTVRGVTPNRESGFGVCHTSSGSSALKRRRALPAPPFASGWK